MLLLFAYHESNEVKWGENEQNSHGVLLLTLNMRYFTFNGRGPVHMQGLDSLPEAYFPFNF